MMIRQLPGESISDAAVRFELNRMKLEAKRLRKASGGEFTHAEALDAVGRSYGYRDWRDTREQVKAKPFGREARS